MFTRICPGCGIEIMFPKKSMDGECLLCGTEFIVYSEWIDYWNSLPDVGWGVEWDTKILAPKLWEWG